MMGWARDFATKQFLEPLTKGFDWAPPVYNKAAKRLEKAIKDSAFYKMFEETEVEKLQDYKPQTYTKEKALDAIADLLDDIGLCDAILDEINSPNAQERLESVIGTIDGNDTESAQAKTKQQAKEIMEKLSAIGPRFSHLKEGAPERSNVASDYDDDGHPGKPTGAYWYPRDVYEDKIGPDGKPEKDEKGITIRVPVKDKNGKQVTRPHAGVDINGVPAGTGVPNRVAGTVIFAGRRTGYGKSVDVLGKDGKTCRYGHLKEFNVRVGDEVKENQTLGRVGNTGVGTGPHLHFEIRKNYLYHRKGGRNVPISYATVSRMRAETLRRISTAKKKKPADGDRWIDRDKWVGAAASLNPDAAATEIAAAMRRKERTRILLDTALTKYLEQGAKTRKAAAAKEKPSTASSKPAKPKSGKTPAKAAGTTKKPAAKPSTKKATAKAKTTAKKPATAKPAPKKPGAAKPANKPKSGKAPRGPRMRTY